MSSNPPRFTPEELRTIERALSVAATVYDEDADRADDAGQPRLRDQFTRQAEETRALAEKIAAA